MCRPYIAVPEWVERLTKFAKEGFRDGPLYHGKRMEFKRPSFIQVWRGCGRIAIGPLFLFRTGMTLTFSSNRSISVWWARNTIRWSINRKE